MLCRLKSALSWMCLRKHAQLNPTRPAASASATTSAATTSPGEARTEILQVWGTTCSTSSITTPEVKGTMSVLKVCVPGRTLSSCVCGFELFFLWSWKSVSLFLRFRPINWPQSLRVILWVMKICSWVLSTGPECGPGPIRTNTGESGVTGPLRFTGRQSQLNLVRASEGCQTWIHHK